MNWNKTLFPAPSILIAWPTIRDTGASPGLIQTREGLPNVAPPNNSEIDSGPATAGSAPVRGELVAVVSPHSAASTLAKHGATLRRLSHQAKRDAVHAELRGGR